MKLNLFKILLPLLIMLAGCGSQDRYEVMDPPGGLVVEAGSWGQVTKLETVHNRLFPYPAAAIGEDFYFGSVEGMIYRPVGTGYEVQPRPEDLDVAALLQGPDGLLWMTDPGGRILYFQYGQWTLDYDLNLSSYSKTSLLLDDQGRILLFGGAGRLWRRELSGHWINQNISSEINIVQGWCDYGQAPVFITDNLQLVSEEAGSWLVSDPLLDETISPIEIQCSQDGRQAVRLDDRYDFLLDEGDGWQIVTGNWRLAHLFWLDNELYGVKTYQGVICKWDGSRWDEIQYPEGDHQRSYCRSVPAESGRHLYYPYGETWFFDGENLTRNTPRLAWATASVLYDGKHHIFTRIGQHLQLAGGIWEDLGYPFGEQTYFSSNSYMAVDDRGELVFFGDETVAQWDGETYQIYPVNVPGYFGYLQPDGKVFYRSSGRLGVWTQGELRWVGYYEDDYYNIYGAHWESDDRTIMMAVGHLTLIEPHQSTILFTFQGWTPSLLAGGQGQKLACAGRGRIIEVDGLSVRDITPLWESADGVSADLSSLIADGFGGWLAFDYERHSLLRFDGQRWLDMRIDFEGSENYYRGLRSNGDGTFLLEYYESVYLVEPEVAP